ncbi:MAG: ABC transporter substrate-binding protein [Anaerolineales bacterium]|nr:ABC transporter substrate-binding protein [Anaerolineales bacterium]
MNTRTKGLLVFSVLLIMSMMFAACATPTAPPPEKIVETVIVEKEGETIIETVVVEKEVEVPAEAAAEGPVVVGEGNLVPCLPLPELPEAVSASAPAPSIVSDVPQVQKPAYLKPQAKAQQGGKVYRVGVFSDITTTNYWAANGPDNTVWNSYMLPDRLSLYSLTDKYFTFVPNAAVALPDPLAQEGDFWVVSIPIQEGITWSDGTAFTADDVAFTANTVLDLGLISGNWSNWYDGAYLDHIEAVDAATVKIFYHTKPGLARHEYGTLNAPILSKAYWEPFVAEAMAPITALGDSPSAEDLVAAQAEAADILFAVVPDGEPLAGAFTLTKWEAGAFLENASRGADYFENGTVVEQWANGAYKAGDVVIGTPEGDPETTYEMGPFQDVVYTIYGSQDAAILAIKNGEVDTMISSLGLQRGLANQLKTDPNLTVVENSVNGFRYISFNTRRAPMNDCAFRQAMAVLIDKEFVTGTILQGVAFSQYSFVAPANEAWYNPTIPELGKGLTREQRTNLARAILEQAGFTWEGGQAPTWDADNLSVTQAGRLIMPDGTPVPPLTMPAPSPGYDPLRSTFAVWIETWANEFGIPLKAQLAGFNVIVPIIFTEQNFDIYMLGWSLGIFPSSLRDFFHTDQAVADGNNAGGYSNPEFDEFSQQLLACGTFEECKKLADELQVILATELPYVVLFDTGIIEAYRTDTVEYPFTTGLSGLQYAHQTHSMQRYVKVK